MTFHQLLAEWSGWVWPLIANHLWQSSFLAIFAFATALVMKNAAGRVRYGLWLMASLKFVVPSTLLVYIASPLGLSLRSSSAGDPGQGHSVIYQLTSPLDQLDKSSTGIAVTGPGHREIFCALTILWFVGFILLLLWWWNSRRQFRLAISREPGCDALRERLALNRVKSWLGIKREVDLSVLSGTMEPSVWGVWRPLVLLPQGIAKGLSDAELEAVLMHEMVHVARWDNLIANLHRILCCFFWFNPIIWVLDRLLLRDRELACDEQVIRLGGAPEVYASSLLKVLRACLGWSVTGASGASGSNLKRRVKLIMSGNIQVKVSVWHRAAICSMATMALTLSIVIGLLARDGAFAHTVRLHNSRTVESENSEIRMPSIDGSRGNIARWFKHIGDSVEVGEPLFEITIDGGTTLVRSTASGLLTQIMFNEGQSILAQTVVALVTPNSTRAGIQSNESHTDIGYALTAQDRLVERLEHAELTAIEFKNSSKSPLTITDARVKAVPRKQGEPGGEYATIPVIAMSNVSNRKINGFTLEFRNGVERRAYYEPIAGLDPGAVFTSGLDKRLIMLLGGPSGWTVKVAGVLFDDGDAWGAVPPPPPPPPPPPLPPPMPPAIPTELLKQIEVAPEVPIQFENAQGVPLSIASASGRFIKASQGESQGESYDSQIHLMRPNIVLTSRAEKKITAIAMEFIDLVSSRRSHIEQHMLSIDPGGSLSFGGTPNDRSAFPVASGATPDRLRAKVVGIRFEDGEVWGSFQPRAASPRQALPSLDLLERDSNR